MDLKSLTKFAAHLTASIKNLQGNEACKEMFFGDDRFFVCHAYNLFGGFLSREDFNKALLDANRLRLLDLARADMPELMNPLDVADSATEDGTGSTYHLLAL